MRFLYFAGFIKIALLAFMIQFDTSDGIIGGFWKSIKNHPYLVLIVYEVPDVCCGSIIMSSWILTAARCVHHGHVGVNGVVGIKIGITTLDKDHGELVRKKSIHIHPHFMSDASLAISVNDIALIQLEKHLEFGPHVHPVGVAFQRIIHNTSCVTMGWGVINPNVYLTGQVKDAAFWPKKGENSLRDIEMQTTIWWSRNSDEQWHLWECKRVMRPSYRAAIHGDYHICGLHYPYAKDPWRDPTADPWRKPKRQSNYYNNTAYGANHGWPWFVYWKDGYDKIRVNTDGPSYYDYGAPLVCFGQQTGIFAFPVANVKFWRPAARAIFTYLHRYLNWVDTEIEIELNRQENSPPVKPDNTKHVSVWDDLNSSKKNWSNKFLLGILIIFIILLY